MEDIVASRAADQWSCSFSRITIHTSNSPSTEGSSAEEISASTHQTSLDGAVASSAVDSPGQARMIRFSTPG